MSGLVRCCGLDNTGCPDGALVLPGRVCNTCKTPPPGKGEGNSRRRKRLEIPTPDFVVQQRSQREKRKLG